MIFNKKIIVVTHGGIGNQLFQLLYGLSLSKKLNANIEVYHDARYAHSFHLDDKLKFFEGKSNFWKFLAMIRLPKILKKLNIVKIGRLDLGIAIILDDYFQDLADYDNFKSENIQYSFNLIKILILKNIIVEKSPKTLVHIRLKDFFNNFQEELLYVINLINKINDFSFIITNNESLFNEPQIRRLVVSKCLTIISTEGKSGNQVILEMINFDKISSNDSTLAFWAALIGDAELLIQNKKLSELFIFLRTLNQQVVEFSR